MPFLVYRNELGEQVIVSLRGDNYTIGRRQVNEIYLSWDAAVSRTHATLQRVGFDWIIEDDGLSKHGTFVDGERLEGRRRLEDETVIFVGSTSLVFVAASDGVVTADVDIEPVKLTPAQRRVLVALCRPFKHAAVASPATNPTIAEELVVSVDAVTARMKELFKAFGIADLGQGEKRTTLAIEALRRGVITRRDL